MFLQKILHNRKKPVKIILYKLSLLFLFVSLFFDVFAILEFIFFAFNLLFENLNISSKFLDEIEQINIFCLWVVHMFFKIFLSHLTIQSLFATRRSLCLFAESATSFAFCAAAFPVVEIVSSRRPKKSFAIYAHSQRFSFIVPYSAAFVQPKSAFQDLMFLLTI